MSTCNLGRISVIFLLLAIHLCGAVVRKYYLAAEDHEWDYAPSNTNVITGKPVVEGR